MLDRSSHVAWFQQRDWGAICKFWSTIIKSGDLPPFVKGSGIHALTDIHALSKCAAEEVSSSDGRYKRQTFALRIGYAGDKYSGFQAQMTGGIRTVQEDITKAVSQSVVAAGRTDKDVSAVSQVISFNTFDDVTSEQILAKFHKSKAHEEGVMRVFECERVPRKFHAQFSATWRRYIYLFPLNKFKTDGFDVDVTRVSKTLSRLAVE